MSVFRPRSTARSNSFRSHVSNSSNRSFSQASLLSQGHLSSAMHVSGASGTSVAGSLGDVYEEPPFSVQGVEDVFVFHGGDNNLLVEEKVALETHPHGYPLALPELIRPVKSEKNIVIRSGGFPVAHKAIAQVSGGVRPSRAPRLLSIELGKLRIFQLIAIDGSNRRSASRLGSISLSKTLETHEPVKHSTYQIQRLTNITYDSTASQRFTLTFTNPKSRASHRPRTFTKTKTRKRPGKGLGSFADVLSDGGHSENSNLRHIGRQKSGFATLKRSLKKFAPRPRKPRSLSRNPLKEPSMQEQFAPPSGHLEKRSKSKSKTSKTAKKRVLLNTPVRVTHPTATRPGTSRVSRNSRESFGSFNGAAGAGNPIQMSILSRKSRQASDLRSTFLTTGTLETEASHALRGNSVASLASVAARVNLEDANNQLIMLDESGDPLGKTNIEVEFFFSTVEQCKDCLRHVLLEIENQALSLMYYAVQSTTEKLRSELLLRKGVDLITLAKGVRNRKVWQARQDLATFLEKHDRLDECKVWYDLSHCLRSENHIYDVIQNNELEDRFGNADNNSYTSFGSFGSFAQVKKEKIQAKRLKSRNEALEKLTEFLEQYGRGAAARAPRLKAAQLIDNYEFLEIALMMEAEYARVPEGYEFYLVDGMKNALEKVREESELMKEEIRQSNVSPTGTHYGQID